MDFNSLYLISNGSGETYPENTLTSFSNKLPFAINYDGQYEVGVNSFGLSCDFLNTELPAHAPVLIVSNCQLTERYLPCSNPNNPDPSCGDQPVKFTFEDTPDCTHHYFYLDSSKYVSIENMTNLQSEVLKTGLQMDVSKNQMKFYISEKDRLEYKSYWLFMHTKFKQRFGFEGYLRHYKQKDTNDPFSKLYFREINNDIHIERIAKYQGEFYFVYHVTRRNYSPTIVLDTSVTSDIYDLEDRHYPKLIKIVCNNIQPQIFNSTYSQDLLIFSPDFKATGNYFYKEIECIDYIPLLSNTLDTINIKVVDENNQQLQLATGHATIIKLDIKKMERTKKSFNVRLTSAKSIDFPDNTNYHFKVKLPVPVHVDNREWKVCVNSINHPANFSAMLIEEATRQVVFKNITDGSVSSFHFKKHFEYKNESLIFELNNFLTEHDIGKFELLPNGQRQLTIEQPGRLIMHKNLAKILGYSGSPHKNMLLISSHNSQSGYKATSENPHIVYFTEHPDLAYLKPNYVILYSNIVKSTVIGGAFSKILKIVPLKNTKLEYVIQEFRNKEFYELENNEIDTIEIQLRSHDGSYINFLTEQDVIINLEFSNYSN